MTLDGHIIKESNNAKKDFENTYMEMIGNTLYVVSRKNKDKTSYEVIQKFDHELNKIEHDVTLEVPWIGQHMLAIKPNTARKGES
ncbi:hypothetical protein EJ419_00580 [Alloscardovia theropitheci]|uniref:Uncharacterized protein n=1 Tax=Alloscardovia theropitheci TaxID=2496842 RepID=A0A4R0QRE2_9BIFI|nr:hypothetical protein [Alloscardovia theropitheci]TCD54924.1 hypothetical protein EJ419_00580 [Alloscardovia theropitheci]